jgi:hypothetical protein
LTERGPGGVLGAVGPWTSENGPRDLPAGGEPLRTLRAVPGRRTVEFRLAGRRCVHKAYRGDEPRDWWYERLRGRTPSSPAAREHRTLCELAALGLPVPRALGRQDQDAPPRFWPPRPGRGAQSEVWFEFVEHRGSADRELAGAPGAERRRLLAALGELVVRFHRAGYYHRDLYLGHLLVGPAGELFLIDLGRARRERRPRLRWWVKDLAALDASAPAQVSRRERLRFFAAWCRGLCDPRLAARRARRRCLRRIASKAERLIAHRPRHDGRVAESS